MNRELVEALFKDPSRVKDMVVFACTRDDDANPPRHYAIVAKALGAVVERDALRIKLAVVSLDDDIVFEYIEISRTFRAVFVCRDDTSLVRYDASLEIEADRRALDWSLFSRTYLTQVMRGAVIGAIKTSEPQIAIDCRLPGGDRTVNGFVVDGSGTIRMWTTPRANPVDPRAPLIFQYYA